MTKEQFESFQTDTETTVVKREFIATRNWWRKIHAVNWKEEFPGRKYGTGNELSKYSRRTINKQLSKFKEEGNLIVFVDNNQYQILDPQRNLLILASRHDFFESEDPPTILPAYFGKLSAEVVSFWKRQHRACFKVTCGELTLRTVFDSQKPSDSPVLYVVLDNTDLEKTSMVPLLYTERTGSKFLWRKSA